MKTALTLALVLWASVASAQPSTCTPPATWNAGTGAAGWYACTATNTWSAASPSLPPGLIAFVASGTCPTGWSEVAALSGVILRGTTAAAGNVGQTGGSNSYTPAGGVAAPVVSWPVGVPTAAAITAGTPAGTISALTTGADSSTTGGVAKAIAQTPTFTGSALATHTHTLSWPVGVPTTGAPAFTGTPATIVPAYLNLIACQKN